MVDKASSALFVRVRGGLCNRLRVIFSYYALALRENRNPYIIQWPENFDHFLDVFEPISRITFENPCTRHTIISTNSTLNQYPWQHLLRELVPKPKLQCTINTLKECLGSCYIAIHMRRTDHVHLAKKQQCFTTNAMFYDFVDRLPKTLKIFVASDNPQSLATMKQRYGTRILNNAVFTPGKTYKQGRHTNLDTAAIDLFVCASAAYFHGSGWSSFSGMINWLNPILHPTWQRTVFNQGAKKGWKLTGAMSVDVP